MANQSLLFLIIFIIFSFSLLQYCHQTDIGATPDGLQKWGYVDVRPGAHMFWLHYISPVKRSDPSRPIILWLQGSPSFSATAFGNFLGVGPFDEKLDVRPKTWLHMADLLFVDSPVGAGFSYFDNLKDEAMTTDTQTTSDLIIFLQYHFDRKVVVDFQKQPLFIIGDGYAAKFAALLGYQIIYSSVHSTLKITLGGVVIGGGWISPINFVDSWGHLLFAMSRLDSNGLQSSNKMLIKIQDHIQMNEFKEAAILANDMRIFLRAQSNNVNFDNFMKDDSMERLVDGNVPALIAEMNRFMNMVIKPKFQGIIPDEVTWGGQLDHILKATKDIEFMKPSVHTVDALLQHGVRVTIYNGQLDVSTSTLGIQKWLRILPWLGRDEFLKAKQTPLYCDEYDRITRGFRTSYANLAFYSYLGAGHFALLEQPCISFNMASEILN